MPGTYDPAVPFVDDLALIGKCLLLAKEFIVRDKALGAHTDELVEFLVKTAGMIPPTVN